MMAALDLFKWLWHALRSWGWHHTGAALLVGMFTLSNMGSAVFFGPDFPWIRSYTYNALQFGFPCVLWLLWAERAVQHGRWPAWLSYGLGVPAVAILGVWFLGPRISDVIGGDANWNANNDRMLAAAVMVPLALVTAATAYWQRSQRAQAALRRAYVERETQAQALSAARLLALQARMEPQMLFDALKRIRDQVNVDDAAADQTLLDLIGLLRAMQPHAQASGSTLGRELALVEGFGKVAQRPELLAPRLRVRASDEARAMPLTPLLLLPLLRSLVEPQLAQEISAEAEPNDWQLEASVVSSKLLVRIRSSAPIRALEMSGFADRLCGVHGSQASLTQTAQIIELIVPIETQTPPKPTLGFTP